MNIQAESPADIMLLSLHQGWRKSGGRLVQANRGVFMPLEDYLQAVAFVAKSLSDENRLRILLCVNDGRKSVSGIVEALNLSQPLVSHHLKELRRSLLVKVERRGPFVYYEIADTRIPKILESLKDLATDLLAERKTF